MSLLFNKEGGTDPQTHVLIIGVGGYPFIQDGKDQKEQHFESAKDSGQLTSPPVSAEAFYNTVIKLHHEGAWIKPLGSIEVLLSVAESNEKELFEGQQLEAATIANIKRSFRQWKRRCDSHEDNVTIFYFCGHGVDKEEHILLAEDFGEEPSNPWEGSFAFDQTRRSFNSCKASTQLFFIDACRNITVDMFTTKTQLYPIDTVDLTLTDCRFSLTQKSAAANRSAYGPEHGVSYYSQSLIKALEGGALVHENDEWTIATGRLAPIVGDFLDAIAPDEDTRQRCNNVSGHSTNILRFAEPPNIDLTISCTPPQAQEIANLSYVHIDTKLGDTRAADKAPWKVSIKPGIYHVKADFPAGTYHPSGGASVFMPPHASRTLNCIEWKTA